MFNVLSDLDDAMVWQALMGCFINFFNGIIQGLVYMFMLSSWLKSNNRQIDCIECEDGTQFDISRFTALRALLVAKHKVKLVLTFDEHMLPTFLTTLRMKTTDENEERGLLTLVIMSLASVCTVSDHFTVRISHSLCACVCLSLCVCERGILQRNNAPGRRCVYGDESRRDGLAWLVAVAHDRRSHPIPVMSVPWRVFASQKSKHEQRHLGIAECQHKLRR